MEKKKEKVNDESAWNIKDRNEQRKRNMYTSLGTAFADTFADEDGSVLDGE